MYLAVSSAASMSPAFIRADWRLSAAAALFARHLSGAQDFGLPLFNLLSISLFLERHAA